MINYNVKKIKLNFINKCFKIKINYLILNINNLFIIC
jgi:hypothetical protein